ncbi:hypothetical protein SMD11_1252 [Streptomyces albireticuli]|uniref:Uncharacterized protein n=1 Tax=Streptomyces albireticuli TaxID=1940 RepID=A0A1Z2KXX6_9ACTN|nr:hypothetical protein SMD11_1252 [Streptomyces albireticuli]
MDAADGEPSTPQVKQIHLEELQQIRLQFIGEVPYGMDGAY